MGHVETQLDRGRDLVDVLPARARRTHEALDQFVVGDLQLVAYFQHPPILLGMSAGLVLPATGTVLTSVPSEQFQAGYPQRDPSADRVTFLTALSRPSSTRGYERR